MRERSVELVGQPITDRLLLFCIERHAIPLFFDGRHELRSQHACWRSRNAYLRPPRSDPPEGPMSRAERERPSRSARDNEDRRSTTCSFAGAARGLPVAAFWLTPEVPISILCRSSQSTFIGAFRWTLSSWRSPASSPR
jgi:hypothetical protein